MLDIHAISAFIGGIFTFLAPCTLPLVPAFLGFIGGGTEHDAEPKHIRMRIIRNAIMYVCGFTTIFVMMGMAIGHAGSFFAEYRLVLMRVGGIFVTIFGLSMTGILHGRIASLFGGTRTIRTPNMIKPGTALSAYIFGAIFALGWSPCIGPVLGSILLLASSTATAWRGATLLFAFSLGIGIPFILLALAYGHATQYVRALRKHLQTISRIGGVFLIFLGILMMTGRMNIWLGAAYAFLEALHYRSVNIFL